MSSGKPVLLATRMSSSEEPEQRLAPRACESWESRVMVMAASLIMSRREQRLQSLIVSIDQSLGVSVGSRLGAKFCGGS